MQTNTLRIITALITLGFTATSLAAGQSIEFFASNNTGTIDPSTAYHRLKGQEQKDLANDMITILQKHHIQQGKTDEVLGAYQMNDGSVTADNTENFIASPYQYLPAHLAFHLAQDIAKALKQESVAVFIPTHKQVSGEVQMKFVSQSPTINETIALLHDKLPAQYSTAYSLHLVPNSVDFSNAKVSAVEWLGSQPNSAEVKAAFPNELVTYKYGETYLVYQNGQKQPL